MCQLIDPCWVIPKGVRYFRKLWIDRVYVNLLVTLLFIFNCFIILVFMFWVSRSRLVKCMILLWICTLVLSLWIVFIWWYDFMTIMIWWYTWWLYDNLYDDFMMMRCHEDTQWWLRSTMGPYGRTCVEAAYGKTMIHSIRLYLKMLARKEWLGCRHDAPPHGRYIRVNTSVGLSICYFLVFMISKSICIIKGTLMVSDFVLAQHC